MATSKDSSNLATPKAKAIVILLFRACCFTQ